MSLVTRCARCQDYLRMEDTALGARVRCPMCRAVFTAQAGTPLDDFRKQFSKPRAENGEEAAREMPVWSAPVPRTEDEPDERPQRNSADGPGRRRRSPEQRRDSSRRSGDSVETQRSHRPRPLILAACLLPLGMPFLLLCFVPGGIVSAEFAGGVGITFGVLTMLVAVLFVMPRWSVGVRAFLSLGTVALGYGIVLLLLMGQWVEFKSGSDARGTLAAGMKRSGKPVQPPLELRPRRPVDPQMRGLVGYWPMDEIEGMQCRDFSGNQEHGTVSNVTVVEGKRERALKFDAERQSYFSFGRSRRFLFEDGQDFTLAGWVRTLSDSGPVLSMRNSRDEHQAIDVSLEQGFLQVIVQGLKLERPEGAPPQLRSKKVINDGQWHHFAVLRDRGDTAALYVDGAPETTKTESQIGGAIGTDLRYLGRADRPREGSTYFSGCIDEFYIFKRQLASAEIAKLAQ